MRASPCMGEYPRRRFDCHAGCEEYAEYAAKNAVLREAKIAEHNARDDYFGVVNGAEKARKRRRERR